MKIPMRYLPISMLSRSKGADVIEACGTVGTSDTIDGSFVIGLTHINVSIDTSGYF